MCVSHVAATCYGETRQVDAYGTVRAYHEADVFRITVETDTDGPVVRMVGRLARKFLKDAEWVCLSRRAR